ncbi:MAG TPA: ABC transporter permease [Patescibacteria group bacterium]|nr:ABC transporter permease [Patescibacteria group bacterium]
MNAIYILWLRELKRYYRSRSRMIGSLGQPILFLVALGFGLGPVFQKAGQGNYFQFLGPGVMSMSILFTAVFAGIQVIWDRQFGFLKETLVAPVSRLNIMLGKTLGGATIAVIQGIVVFLLAVLFGFRPNLTLLPLTLVFMALIAVLFTGLGIAIASTLEDINGFQIIMNFLVQPLFFLSGALFPLDNLPKFISVITSFDPLTYGVDGIRGTLIGNSHFGVSLDLLVLVVIAGVILSLGAYLFSRVQI